MKMILSAMAIHEEVDRGRISISPFHPERLNPNSYNYTLARELKVFDEAVLDPCQPQAWRSLVIPEDGLILESKRLYLGATRESIGSRHFVPCLIGRSSLGRLGIFLEVSAELGNLGSPHKWTLEITVVQPVRIYVGMVIGQVSFWACSGPVKEYQGAYHDFDEPMPNQYLDAVASTPKGRS